MQDFQYYNLLRIEKIYLTSIIHDFFNTTNNRGNRVKNVSAT